MDRSRVGVGAAGDEIFSVPSACDGAENLREWFKSGDGQEGIDVRLPEGEEASMSGEFRNGFGERSKRLFLLPAPISAEPRGKDLLFENFGEGMSSGVGGVNVSGPKEARRPNRLLLKLLSLEPLALFCLVGVGGNSSLPNWLSPVPEGD